MIVEGTLAVTIADARAEDVHFELRLGVDGRHRSSLKSLYVVEIFVGHSQVIVCLLEV